MFDAADSRVPVLAGDAVLAGASDVVLPAVPAGAPFHIAGCTCCRPRPPLAEALARLFFARARGEIAFFARVVVPCAPGEEAGLAAALAADPLTRARFRFAGRLPVQGGTASSSPSASGNCI